MKPDFYQSIKEPSEALYREKGSKFIGLAYPLTDESAVKEIIDNLRKKHPGACHFCYAYRIGQEGQLYRANDDGEPGGSAGKPIYNQLLSFEVSDVLVVVVRYFGGTKLGVSGLINAYKEATKESLINAHIIQKQVSEYIELTFSFNLQGEVEKLLRDFQGSVVEKSFTHQCSFRIEVPKSKKMGFVEKCKLVRHLEIVSLKNQE